MNVLICDDSSFARKQMARAIPADWDVTLHYAENGQEALNLINEGKADLLFLDLNMPVLDGYQTMQVIRKQDLPCLVIVVSGDVQAEARQRMLSMGALEFVRKPIDQATLVTILNQYGLYSGTGVQQAPVKAAEPITEESRRDAYRELVNVAMGRAGEHLAAVLNTFIDLPIPNVNVIERSELVMAIADINRNEQVSAISKGFVSAGVKGEALVIFNDTNTANLIPLLKYDSQQSSQQLQLEALIDVSNIVIGACLNALSSQLHVNFSHTQPVLLAQNKELEAVLQNNVDKLGRILAIEITYAIKSADIRFDLLLLFPEDALEQLYMHLVEEE